MWLMPALLLTLCMARVQAGKIAPELQNNWSQIGGTDKVVALFHLWERVDLREMDITLREMRVTRQLRHQIVEKAQRVARELSAAVFGGIGRAAYRPGQLTATQHIGLPTVCA